MKEKVAECWQKTVNILIYKELLQTNKHPKKKKNEQNLPKNNVNGQEAWDRRGGGGGVETVNFTNI